MMPRNSHSLTLALICGLCNLAFPQSWTQINTDGFGDANNEGSFPMHAYNSKLYVSTDYNSSTGQAEVWRYDDSTSTWTEEVWNFLSLNDSVEAMATFQSHFYMGTKNVSTGCEIWEWDGTSPPSWSQVNSDGFNNLNHNEEAQTLVEYGSQLYAGTINQQTGCEVWRYDGGGGWTQVGTGGLGNPTNTSVTALLVHNGEFYASTENPSMGGEVRRYAGATTWNLVSLSGLNGNPNNVEVTALREYNGGLYAGTQNSSIGGGVWLHGGGTLWTQTLGFANANNIAAFPAVVVGGALKAGTMNSLGGQIWSYDGSMWSLEVSCGFNDPRNHIIAPVIVHNQLLYAIAGNFVSGGEVWRYSNAMPSAYCFGDGNGTPCPCGNNNNGCPGGCSWGSPVFPGGAILDGTGSTSMLANDANLVANGVENDFGIFFGANNQVNGGNGNPLNDGLRCAGGGLVRLTPPTMATGSQATTPLPVQTLDPAAAAGVTRRYQYWFRTPGGPCAQMANLTNGYQIVWLP